MEKRTVKNGETTVKNVKAAGTDETRLSGDKNGVWRREKDGVGDKREDVGGCCVVCVGEEREGTRGRTWVGAVLCVWEKREKGEKREDVWVLCCVCGRRDRTGRRGVEDGGLCTLKKT